jgi:hypothetical protein
VEGVFAELEATTPDSATSSSGSPTILFCMCRSTTTARTR